jgi:hypothetical protein
MKRILFLSIVLIVMLLPLTAENIFVTSRVCPLMSEAAPGSARVAALRQGEELEVLNRQGDWIQVTTVASGKRGFVQSLFTGSETSQERVSRAGSMENIATVTQRRRASAYQTSAAATRGLSTENVRDRENVAFGDYDFDSIQWLESLVISEEDVLSFAESQGIGL